MNKLATSTIKIKQENVKCGKAMRASTAVTKYGIEPNGDAESRQSTAQLFGAPSVGTILNNSW